MISLPVLILFVLFTLLYLITNKEDFTTISRIEKCNKCGLNMDSRLLYCPYCEEQVKKYCNHCGRLIDLDWKSCPFCESVAEDRIMQKN